MHSAKTLSCKTVLSTDTLSALDVHLQCGHRVSPTEDEECWESVCVCV